MQHKSNVNNISRDNTKWFTIPYIQGFSDRFKSIVNGINLNRI